MKTLTVDLTSDEYPNCPLRSDLNTCQATEGSAVNSCPKLNDEGDCWTVPEWCPLRKGGVLVRSSQKE